MKFLRNWFITTFICGNKHDWVCFSYRRDGKNIVWEHRGYKNENQHRCSRCDKICPFGQVKEVGQKIIDNEVRKLAFKVDYNINA